MTLNPWTFLLVKVNFFQSSNVIEAKNRISPWNRTNFFIPFSSGFSPFSLLFILVRFPFLSPTFLPPKPKWTNKKFQKVEITIFFFFSSSPRAPSRLLSAALPSPLLFPLSPVQFFSLLRLAIRLHAIEPHCLFGDV